MILLMMLYMDFCLKADDSQELIAQVVKSEQGNTSQLPSNALFVRIILNTNI